MTSSKVIVVEYAPTAAASAESLLAVTVSLYTSTRKGLLTTLKPVPVAYVATSP